MGRLKEFVVEEAVEKACDLFWAHGYEATSLSDLTEKMQIQRPSLYGTFGSKAELFQQALKQYQRKSLKRVEELLSSGSDPRDSLLKLLLSAIPEPESLRHGCFCVNVAIELGPHDPQIAQLLEAHFEKVHGILGRTIAAGQAQGQLTMDLSPREAGAYLLTCLNGLHVAAKTTTDVSQLRRHAERMLRALHA